MGIAEVIPVYNDTWHYTDRMGIAEVIPVYNDTWHYTVTHQIICYMNCLCFSQGNNK